MKKINVVILEDETFFIDLLKNHLDQWSKDDKHPCELHISVFTSGKKLIQAKWDTFDILFIDIGLEDEMDGVETAKELRKNHYKGAIVFTTALGTRFRDGFQVAAIDYCTKPVNYQDIEHCMNKVLESITAGSYVFKAKSSTVKISVPYNDIICFQTQKHYIEIISIEKTYSQLITIDKIKPFLPMQFIQCHRTVIVNMEHIALPAEHEISMFNGSIYTISKTFAEPFWQAYIAFIK